MPNNDRGIIKWQPFNSVISANTIVNSILKAKNKIDKPILSIDQLNYLNNMLLEKYYDQDKVKIIYFKNNEIKEIKGIITNINESMKTVIINNHLKLHISQILQIKT